MKLLLVGTPEVALPTFEALAASDHQVVAVLTRTPAARGRSRKLLPSPVGQWAQEQGLEVIEADSLREPAAANRVRQTGAQLAVVVAYGALIPQSLLEAFEYGWINLHFSQLPRWRGAAPVQRALEAGDTQIATSVFQIEAGLDTGPVFNMRTYPIDEDVNAGELLAFLAQEAAGQVVEVVDQIAAGTAVAKPQPANGVTVAPKLGREEMSIDPHASAATIHNFVRARAPRPTAVAFYQGQRVKIFETKIYRGQLDVALEAGQLHATKRELLMGTGDGILQICTLAPAGKSRMEAAAWARGARLDPSTAYFSGTPSEADRDGL